jgi:putative flippase GtrA
MEKIENLMKEILTKEVIFYIIFGILTTIVNLGSFFVMNDILNWNENISNFIAIILAVLFAYITNKDLVFHSEAKTSKEKIDNKTPQQIREEMLKKLDDSKLK